MRNFQDTFKTRKQSFINAFSICMTVPLKSSIAPFYKIFNFKSKHFATVVIWSIKYFVRLLCKIN